MEQFTVPQFIEREPRILGPLTFKQSAYFGVAGLICFILYFTVSINVFTIAAIFLMSIASALAFVKIQGFPLPKIIKNFIVFSFRSNLYLWKKQGFTVRPFELKSKEKKIDDRQEKNTPMPKIKKGSKLNQLSVLIETKK